MFGQGREPTQHVQIHVIVRHITIGLYSNQFPIRLDYFILVLLLQNFGKKRGNYLKSSMVKNNNPCKWSEWAEAEIQALSGTTWAGNNQSGLCRTVFICQ